MAAAGLLIFKKLVAHLIFADRRLYAATFGPPFEGGRHPGE
jgi:hypothetical protein